MNNYWFTNFRAGQEGEFRWSYVLTSAAPATGSAAADFGWGARIPLVGRVLSPGTSAATLRPQGSVLAIDEPDLLLVAARPAREGGGLVLHVREVDGKPATLAGSFTEATVLGTPISTPQTAITFLPYETKFLKTTPTPKLWIRGRTRK